MAMLSVNQLVAHYGRSQALFGVDISVRQGEVVALLGANGSGKSTVLRTISGLLKPSSGTIHFQDKPIHGLPPHRIVRLGISQVPEGRGLFPNMTVRENLLGGQYTRKDARETAANWERVIGWFPVLGGRMAQLAGTLSGGEQQMLAIGRAFLANPTLLLLDEPSLGLSPLLVETIFQSIAGMNASAGLSILVAEQNVSSVLQVAQRGYVLELGHVAGDDTAEGLRSDRSIMQSYLGDG